ncbi:MAG: helix-turn-helix domain-containing protein, partial [Acidimicrobiia bacterium]
VILRRAGEPRRAAGAQRYADRLRARCDGAVTPSLQAAGIRVPLTRSERRAAVMAAGGRSNREVAAALCLSVRTVENHLQRVYEKLGISGRTELSGALGPDGEVAAGA